jgi:glycosyltransferase involved in cell wall biosynthesis
MKIGFFTDAYFPQVNGVATSVDAWAKGLEELGHKVYIVAPNYPGYKDRDGIIRLTSLKVLRQPEIRLAVYLPAKSILKVSKVNFDIIHAFSGGTVSTLGLIVARLKKVPFVFTYYTRWNQYTHYFFKGKVIRPKMVEGASRIFCNRCDFLIAPMPKIKDELMAYGVKKPIFVIPSGVDLKKFRKIKKGFLRKIAGIDKGKILLYVGRLGKEKSVDFLLKAFQKVHDKDPFVKMVLVGDGPEKTKIEELSSRLNIKKNVYFTGLVNHDDINKVYADADLFVFASQTETQGMVILEALASGLPVVAVNDAVYEGIIKDKKNGILVSNDIDQFAKACLFLLNNATYRKKLSENAVKFVEKFSISTTTETLEKLYEKLIYQYNIERHEN